MLCKKCHKEIADGSVFCNWCGKKQQTEKRKKAKRARGTGTIRFRADYPHNHYVAFSPADKYGKNSKYLGSYPTYKEAQIALEKYQEDKMLDALKKYEQHFNQDVNTEPSSLTDDEWTEILEYCVKENISYEEFVGDEYDPDADY